VSSVTFFLPEIGRAGMADDKSVIGDVFSASRVLINFAIS
jgi:hypothetical protein